MVLILYIIVDVVAYYIKNRSKRYKACTGMGKQSKKYISAERRLYREKLVVQRRRHACACKGIAAANVTFHERGAATERTRKAHPRDGLFDNSVVRCGVVRPKRLELPRH